MLASEIESTPHPNIIPLRPCLPSSSSMLSPAMKWWRPIAMQTVKWWVHEGDPMDDMGHSNLLLWAWGPVYSLLFSEQPIQHMRWPCIPCCRFQGQKSIGFPAKPRLHSRITWHQRQRERHPQVSLQTQRMEIGEQNVIFIFNKHFTEFSRSLSMVRRFLFLNGLCL